MGREIEIKIQLSESEYDNLMKLFILQSRTDKEITITDVNKNLIIKRDEYYSKYETREERVKNNEPQCIRLRTEEIERESKTYFTLKYKRWENGIELNQEDETYIEAPEVLREFFNVSGYRKWFDKIKRNYSSWCTWKKLPDIGYHVELENVNGLLYLEIEVTQNEGDAAIIKQSLFDFVSYLGIDPERKDSRSWIEIILQNK